MAIALVNQTWASITASGSQDITIPATTAGNFLLVNLNLTTAASVIWTPSNVANDTFVAVTSTPGSATDGPPPQGFIAGTNSYTSFAWAHNIAAGTTTITIAQQGISKAGNIGITEWSGVAKSGAVTASTGAGNSTASTQLSKAITSTVGGSCIVASECDPSAFSATLDNSSSVPNSGWIALTGSSNSNTHASAYQIFPGTTSNAQVAWTISSAIPTGVVAVVLAPETVTYTVPKTIAIAMAPIRPY